jgi:Sulfotransferase family
LIAMIIVPCLYSKKFNYILKHRQKSGSSTLRKMFLEIHGEELNVELSHYNHSQTEFIVPENLDLTKVRKLLVVRNPYSRIVSAFIDKYINDDKSCVSIKQVFLEKGIILHRDDFISFVRKIRLLRDEGVLDMTDMHIRRQSFDLQFDEMTFVVRLEKLREGVVDFYSMFFKEHPDGAVLIERVCNFFNNNPYENFTNYSKMDYKNMSSFLFEKNGPWPHFTRMYDRECEEIVRDVYEEDFELFSYPKSLRSGKIIV